MSEAIAAKALVASVWLPFASAALLGIAGAGVRKRLLGAVVVGSIALCFALTIAIAAWVGVSGSSLLASSGTWLSFPLDGAPVELALAFRADPLSLTFALIITGVGALIHLFATSYMHDDQGFRRFFALLNGFVGAMLILVYARDLPVLLLGWEGVGVCSYFLIGFWHERKAFQQAARKAFLVNRVGDAGVLLGMFLLAAYTSSFDLSVVGTNAKYLRQPVDFGLGEGPMSVAGLAAALLFIGAAAKSAQWPLHVWLPDAMAGPTPVSALIHAATMVTAGLYLCCRVAPLFEASPVLMEGVMLLGAWTGLLAAAVACCQTRLKRVLAYSTVSQLGFMFAALGTGAYAVALMHLLTHAFFKAGLFLAAGSVMHATHNHDDFELGSARGLGDALPQTRLVFAVCAGALAGFPLLSGFFSKDAVLAATLSSDTSMAAIATAMLVAAAAMTAFYIARAYLLTFAGSLRPSWGTEPQTPWPMRSTLVALAFGAAFLGWLQPEALHIQGSALGDFLRRNPETLLLASSAAHESFWALGLSLSALALGLGLAWVQVTGARATTQRLASIGMVLQRLQLHLSMDCLIDQAVVKPLAWLRTIVRDLDRVIFDGLILRLPGSLAQLLSRGLRRAQTGVVHSYALLMVLGAVAAFFWASYPRAIPQVRAAKDGLRLDAQPGAGYRYRWDLGNDGRFESTNWSDSPRLEVPVPQDLGRAWSVVLHLPSDEGRPRTFPSDGGIAPGEHLLLRRADFGLPEASEPASESGIKSLTAAMLPIALANRDGEMRLRPNGHTLTLNDRPIAQKQVSLRAGDRIEVGAAALTIHRRVVVALHVRSALARESRTVTAVLLPAVSPPSS